MNLDPESGEKKIKKRGIAIESKTGDDKVKKERSVTQT